MWKNFSMFLCSCDLWAQVRAQTHSPAVEVDSMGEEVKLCVLMKCFSKTLLAGWDMFL